MSAADKPGIPNLEALPGETAPGKTRTRGVDVVKAHLPRLPAKPGVYRMIGADGEVLYVGKAKNLRARVTTYAQGRGHGNHIVRMVSLTEAMDVIVTATETEALLLEANMIKRLKPRFNVILRDDKSFPYIAIRQDHVSPALQKHRGAKSFKGQFFGPFASANAVNRTLNTLQKAFLLRSCSDSVYTSRTRPCMLYQIKRCSAPCTGEIEVGEYARLVEDAVAFLNGKSDELQDSLAQDMHEAAEALAFEQAARLRNRIRALAAVRALQGINVTTFKEADVFALHGEGGQTCMQVFFFRAGQNWGNRAYFPKHDREATPPDIMAAFLAQFYDDKEPPSLVLVSETPAQIDVLEAALEVRAARAVEIRRPERGEKREIMDQAIVNAREALGRRVAENANVAKLLDAVAEAFDLPTPPERIEVYDNSHIQGTNAVGAMIVAGPEGFRKNQYRKFNIKSAALTPGDDYAMMRQVMSRRFGKLARQIDVDETDAAAGDQTGGVDFSKPAREDKFGEWPDLVLVDGGEGQLNAALGALEDLGLLGKVKVIGVAKGEDRDAGRERFFSPGRPPWRLDEKSPVLYYLQRLRDEAHRFAIGAHRQRRSGDLTKSPLDEIDGVGPARKKALLARFGSARGVARAAQGELEHVEGINQELARRIYDYFRN